MTNLPEVLGIGSAIVDYLVQVPHAFLSRLDGAKHGMQLVENAELHALLRQSQQIPTLIAGGSAANVLKGLAGLGRSTALIGPVGNDSAADMYHHFLASCEIGDLLTTKPLPTAQVLCLIDPEGQRTFRTYLGASAHFRAEDIQEHYFHGARLVHLAGYSLHTPGIIPRAIHFAKAEGALISMDLSSHEIVTSFAEELLQLLKEHVSIVFCNEDEARALSGGSAEACCDMLRELCDVSVVSLGEKGCIVGSKDGLSRFPAYPVKAIDTTGAGDFFAAGFLHGYLGNQPLEACAHYGAILGNAVVQVLGAEIHPAAWPSIRAQVPAYSQR
jgi:sugar/nucleoside kinase (ribokinase family)